MKTSTPALNTDALHAASFRPPVSTTSSARFPEPPTSCLGRKRAIRYRLLWATTVSPVIQLTVAVDIR